MRGFRKFFSELRIYAYCVIAFEELAVGNLTTSQKSVADNTPVMFEVGSGRTTLLSAGRKPDKLPEETGLGDRPRSALVECLKRNINVL